MTVLVEKATDTPAAPAVDEAAPDDLASWHIRAAALAVDVVPGVAVVATMALVWLAVPPQGLWWWVSISILVFAALATMANRAVLPAVLGWSLGRALFGISVVRQDGAAVGVGRLMVRELAHLLDTLSVFVGWLWPLWDSRRRTFADLLTGTEVRVVDAAARPADIKRRTAIAVGVAVALCVAGAAISIFAIFLPDRAADQTRTEVNAQGPRIVAQMLTYDPKTLQQDFDHARSLTTDKYRPELVKQQEAVQKGHPVINEYWVTDSTVLSASRRSANMLLFMQGHRGGGDEERFITATVRVALVKGGNGQWLVDNLDVVTKPKPAPAKSAPNPAPPGPASPAPPAPPKGEK
ncbi:RDD family protein [Candidatus Mycobacterium wuenschmannii]|uniref:RDD family protein n=1 Tax=Candidatus Mycobacterium wuenschmannii TaxID=3027808 RepID=A0ABY8VWD3_9MYCO|nr:RDD family protein [Candidatus Mycobacterium wuenschmannii]WIM86982.1 RDD family protein [Candidatus Mycobacterium wuenschmannii]